MPPVRGWSCLQLKDHKHIVHCLYKSSDSALRQHDVGYLVHNTVTVCAAAAAKVHAGL